MLKRDKEALHRGIEKPAAFGRLCVETFPAEIAIFISYQPPSGGCVLKQVMRLKYHLLLPQPPLGGCVLKHQMKNLISFHYHQPPSGGCVLKRPYPR